MHKIGFRKPLTRAYVHCTHLGWHERT